MKISELFEALDVLKDLNITPLITGPAGVGKSQTVAQYAASRGYNLIDLRVGQMSDAGDLMGLPLIDVKERVTNFIAPKFLPKEGSGKHIIFLDEINRSSKDILQCIFQLVYDKALGDWKANKNDVMIIAAQNPPTEDYDVLDFTDVAYADRFCHITLTPTVDEWLGYASKKGLHKDVIDFYTSNPESLDRKEELYTPKLRPGRRSADRFGELMNKDISESVKKELAYGIVGVELATRFFAFQEKQEKFDAMDVFDRFSKNKKKFEEWSNDDTNRNDILSTLNQKIKLSIETNSKFTDKQVDNLIKYLLIIPKDMFFAFMQEVLETEYATKSDFHKKFANLLDSDLICNRYVQIQDLGEANENNE